ncbi:MAG: hypothetical protein QRY72_05815 [Candidatus Rhabdochlamydia sp.]
MSCKVLINPTTYEAYVKMHTDASGQERVEILEPHLIALFTRRGMKVPLYYQTQEMQEKNIHYLKLNDLQKNPDFFTYVFKETVCKTRFLSVQYYWKDGDDYIDAASEKKHLQELTQQRNEHFEKKMITLREQCKEAQARGTTLWEEKLAECNKTVEKEEQEIHLLDDQIRTSTQAIKHLHLNKRVAKKMITPLRPVKSHSSSLNHKIERSTEVIKNLPIEKKGIKTSSTKFTTPLRELNR